jgi:hypothetical protein
MSLWDHFNQGPEPGRTERPKRAERRAMTRRRQRLIDGFVFSARVPTPRPCTVCDMTAKGSKVQIWNDDARPLLLGECVTLYIAGDRKEVDGEVIWRRENAMGVRFTSAFRAPKRPYC